MTRLRCVPLALAVTGLVLLPPCLLHAQPARLSRWLEVVNAHVPGQPGPDAIEAAVWSKSTLEVLVDDIRKHVRSLDRSRRSEGNELLLRGAAFHADVAMLVRDDVTRSSPTEQGIFVVEDGRQQGVRYPTLHWAVGRALLDLITPAPEAEADALYWYRFSSIYLLRNRVLSEALVHLDRAREIFPADPDILLDSAYLYERFASPPLQAAADEIQASTGNRPEIGSERAELGRAERFFRQALAIRPDASEARVRFGRVLGQLGRHREAAVELRRAIKDGLTADGLYLAHLFLGREEEALRNRAAARASFERAAELYPRAQSPYLALSQMARQSGDREGAIRGLQQVAELPADERQREDPWWNYYDLR